MLKNYPGSSSHLINCFIWWCDDTWSNWQNLKGKKKPDTRFLDHDLPSRSRVTVTSPVFRTVWWIIRGANIHAIDSGSHTHTHTQHDYAYVEDRIWDILRERPVGCIMVAADVPLNRTRIQTQVALSESRLRRVHRRLHTRRNNETSFQKPNLFRRFNYSHKVAIDSAMRKKKNFFLAIMQTIFYASSPRSIDEGVSCARYFQSSRWRNKNYDDYAGILLEESSGIKLARTITRCYRALYRYIRLPGTHNGASPCSIKSYADLGATMERGRSDRHTKKVASRIPKRFLDRSFVIARCKGKLAWLYTCGDTDPAANARKKNAEY